MSPTGALLIHATIPPPVESILGHYTTSELILLGYRSIFKKYHTKTPRDKIGEISTTTCQWVTIHLLDTMCEMNGMCRETVVRK